MGIGDQFRLHPAPIHRLFADDRRFHTRRDQGRVLCGCLSAGMPFAPSSPDWPRQMSASPPRFGGLDRRDHRHPLPIGLPLAIDAVDVQLEVSVSDVVRRLLLFLLLPLVLGCGFRVWWSDLTAPLAQGCVRVAILCLLFNLNFTLVAYWDLFVEEWGTESYIAAVPAHSLGSGAATFSFPVFESKTSEPDTRPR